MTAYNKIQNFIPQIQNEVWELEGDDAPNDLMFEFDKEYKYSGVDLGTNVLLLNFFGSSEHFYFISVPDVEMATFKETVDQYPVYHVDFECLTIERVASNYRAFMGKWFPDDPRLEQFSQGCKEQQMPVMRMMDDEEIELES